MRRHECSNASVDDVQSEATFESQVCATLQAKLLKEQLEVVKYRDADTGALRYSIRPVEGQLSFDKVQLRSCLCCGRRLSAVLLPLCTRWPDCMIMQLYASAPCAGLLHVCPGHPATAAAH
jgi:hypothetical protein